MSEREYKKSHPWLTFSLDLRHDLDYRSWLLLGESESKCSHISGAAVTPDVEREMHMVYVSKGIHGTTSIEGNTLSEAEVRRRISGDLNLPRSREYLGREIDNIIGISNELVDELDKGRVPTLSVDQIKAFNRKILDGLPLDEDVVPGETRTHSVGVGLNYRGAPAEDCEHLLERLVDWLNELSAPESSPELRFPIAVLKAILAHLYIAWIHPFGDGNGRTARMIEFQLMINAGAPTPAAHLLSNHYNQTRDAYLIELSKTSRSGKAKLTDFINYALQGLVDQLRDQIDAVRGHQYQVMWEKVVHDTYHNEETPAKVRQRHLALDMPLRESVSKSKLPEVSARVARDYAAAGPKTITRDVNELLKRKLLQKTPSGYVANHGIVSAFLPLRLID